MLEWHVVNSATYYAAESASLNSDFLYFLSDTKEIYKGAVPFSQAVEMLSAPDYTLPTTPARKRIYVNPSNLEGKIYDGSQWVTIIKPVSTAVAASDPNPVSGGAVKTYVDEAIADLAASDDVMASLVWNESAHKLTYTMADGTTTHDVPLSGLAVDLSYDSTTGALQVVDASGTALGTAVNLDLERFIQSASYDHQTRKITLNFNDATDPLEIDVGDLVDTYTAAAEDASKGAKITVTNNEFAVEAIVSAATGNQLQKTAQGLFVAAYDDSDVMKLVASATAGDVATLNGQGQATDSGYTLGGSAMAATPGATTLATEAAVAAAISAAITALDLDNRFAEKVDKVSSATAGNIATFVSGGNIADTGKTIGGSTLAASPTANTVATEAAVKAYADSVGDLKVAKTDIVTTIDSTGTDSQVPSAAAAYAALSWKTTL